MTTEQLHYFMVLANYKNYSVAAEHLFISQSSLSRHISTFEDDLGAKLFIRKNNGIVLTSAGRYLYSRVPQLIKEIQQIQVECRSLDDGIVGTFTVVLAEDQQINPWLTAAIRRFRETKPNVSVVLQSNDRDQLIDGLIKGETDLAIAVQYYTMDFPRMEGIVFAEDETVLIVPKDHENAGADQIALAEISGRFPDLTMFINEPSKAYWMEQLQKFVSRSDKIDLCPMIDQTTTSLSIAAGLGMTLRNRWSNIHANDSTRAIRIIDPLPKLRLSAAYNPRTDNAHVGEFLALLKPRHTT